MIERIGTTARMCKIVAYNGVAYLCGQVGAGETVAEQTRNCLARVVALLTKVGSSPNQILQAIIWLADNGLCCPMAGRWLNLKKIS
jgi:enamine deaminase RidA (YjgF/YER057c/UK114 family)